MRYSTFFKFVAVILCAASLLGMAGSAAGIFFLTELGDKSVREQYEDQLENQALGYGITLSGIYASRELGNANQNLINQHWGNDWENWYFNWTRVGYTLYDSEGNVLQEQEIPGNRHPEYVKTFPVGGRYIKVISSTPREEYTPQTASPADPAKMQVHMMPSQGNYPIGGIYIDYTDGNHEEWVSDKAVGTLWYSGGNILTLESNQIGGVPSGDGWYPNHIMLLDMGGNVVYEASAETCVFIGEEQDGAFYKIHLPADTVTTEAPVGITYTDGDYTSYDAIPEQGITVAQMNVTYGDQGSEGITSPDLIGTVFHDHQGNARFRSTDPMTMDIPDDVPITHISFRDGQDNLIFDAVCPDGVGRLFNDEYGYLVFSGQMPGTVLPEDVPQETIPEETVMPAEPEGQLGFAETKIDIYNMPSTNGTLVGSLEAGQEFRLLQQESFSSGGESRQWGLISEGWILLEHVLLADIPAAVNETLQVMAEETAPEETAPVLARSAESVPEETEAMPAEPEAAAAPKLANQEETPAADEAAATAVIYPEEDIETAYYYDTEQNREMVAQYVWEAIPQAYTLEIRLARGALRSELGWTLLRLAETFRSILLETLAICIAVFALCVVHLSCSAGRTRRNNEVRAGGLNRVPLDLYLAAGAAAEIGLVALAMTGSEYLARNDEQLAIIFLVACAYSATLLLVGFCFAFVAQAKTPGGYWWRNSLCGRILRLLVRWGRRLSRVFKKFWVNGKPASGNFFRWLRRTGTALWVFAGNGIRWLWDTAKRLLLWSALMLKRCLGWTTGKFARFFGMLPITWQFLATGFTLVFLLYVMMRTYKVGYILLGFGIFFAVILYAASAFAILLESAGRMSRGDLDTNVDDRMLIGGFREFAHRLNDLAGVAVIAAQKQLKSERMKTELITNVSHDIKTPLTSIINYVDLLKKPHTQQQQEQYLEVLDRQSHRLKKLVDDLMEMSKASSGNLAVDIERVDAAEAVNQALGEFADKLERAQLIPVFRQPDDQVYMMADGRLVWRVMSNLLSNAVKYALPGTRIYLDLLEMDGKVIISMKNISREELNINADELMERFVRGDASRNTEGSGLGLNIAQSLMELQKGQLQILVDGDLFKVTLIFPGI